MSLRLDVPQGNIPDEEWQQIQAAGQDFRYVARGEEYFKVLNESLAFVLRIYDELGIPYL